MSFQQAPDGRAGTPSGSPPGWYRDPNGVRILRWWDGFQWTSHTQSGHGTAASAPQSTGIPDRVLDSGPGRPSVIPQADTRSRPRGLHVKQASGVSRTGIKVGIGAAVLVVIAVVVVVGLAASAHSSGNSASGVAQYCELQVTWRTGASMTIAEGLNTTLVSSCDDLASNLTQGSQGNFTAVSNGSLTSMPAGICSVAGVTLVGFSTSTAEVACDGLDQNINYLVP
jgi:Protein of unknown function (DUF2510)